MVKVLLTSEVMKAVAVVVVVAAAVVADLKEQETVG